MPKRSTDLLHRLTVLSAQAASDQSDQHLLERFVRHQDEGAFAAILERHGPMILGTCRRILREEHLAEDVFQATFLLLVRNAGVIRQRSSLAAWLHGVASRLARKAQADSVRAARRDYHRQPEPASEPVAEANWREVQQILDEELRRLPERYRLPLILCYLEGLPQEEAASKLGWTPGKLRGILERARERLRRRLIQRGLAPTALGLVLLAETTLAAPVPPLLAAATLRIAVRLALGEKLCMCGVSETVVSLMGGSGMMSSKQSLIVLILALGLGVLGTSAGLLPQLIGSPDEKRVELAAGIPQTTVPATAPADPSKGTDERKNESVPEQKGILEKTTPAEKKPPTPPAADPDRKYDIAADDTQPAKSPILLKLTMTNTGKMPLTYWCGLSGDYPPLYRDTKARVTDANGKVSEVQISNGQAELGSGFVKSLAPGDSIIIPAVIGPMPPGNYLIEFSGGSARVTIKDDADLLKKREQDLRARISGGNIAGQDLRTRGSGEPFAEHVVITYPTQSLLESYLRDLSGDDVETAECAVRLLARVPKLPEGTVPFLAKAMDKQFTPLRNRIQRGVMLSELAGLAARIGSDEALELVVKLSHNESGEGAGIGALGLFKQERVTKELHTLLTSKDEISRYYAAQTLAERKDVAAIEVMAAIVSNPKTSSTLREYGCRALVNFPKDERAEEAIRSCLSDIHCRDAATEALNRILEARKKP